MAQQSPVHRVLRHQLACVGGVGGVGLAQGALGIDVEEGSDGAVDGGDAVEMGLGELA